MVKSTPKPGILIVVNKLRKKMHKFTICNGRFVGDFEGLYKKFNDPFLQSKKEKFEISKKAIINYCQLLQSSKKEN